MSALPPTTGPLYGIIARFESPRALLDAARRARAAGYERVEGYSAVAVDGLAEALGHSRRSVARASLLGGLCGGLGAFAMQTWADVWDYPLNIGGRPDFSWPAFVPVTFELTVLGAALSAVLAMLLSSGLPRLHHPIFDAPGIEAASRDGFFLCIEAADPAFDAERTRAFLASLEPLMVAEVPGR
ncbi:MAG: DUF3341 domain-containing protein [Deltaproteobacteria bacterium]|nr:DUF3341 domain-containing protein [Deltaproteobacteria bacterium]